MTKEGNPMKLLLLTALSALSTEPARENIHLAQCAVASNQLDLSPYVVAEYNMALIKRLKKEHVDDADLYGTYMYLHGFAEGQLTERVLTSNKTVIDLSEELYTSSQCQLEE